jgi:hypothetical protein
MEIHPDHDDSCADVCAWLSCIIDIDRPSEVRVLAKGAIDLFVMFLTAAGVVRSEACRADNAV